MNLCKSLVSAASLGYPTATLSGWEEPTSEHGGEAQKQYSLVARAEQIRDHLQTLQDDDMIVIADGLQTVSVVETP